MAKDNTMREFERQKKLIEEQVLKISELRGELKSAEQQAQSKFNTSDPKELGKIKKDLEEKVQKLKDKFEGLKEELDEKLREIEELEDAE